MTFVLNFRLIGNIHEQALKKQIARVEKDLTKYLVLSYGVLMNFLLQLFLPRGRSYRSKSQRGNNSRNDKTICCPLTEF